MLLPLLPLALIVWGSAHFAPAASAGANTSETSGACTHDVTPGSTTLTLTIGGRPRVVIVHVPTGYNGKPVPLVLNLHGSGSTAAEQEGFTGMDATADANSFIVAYPQAAIPSGTGFDWNVPNEPLIGGARAPAGAPNDVAFLTDLVAKLGSRYCIDGKHVYATGFSGGARMASQLGCDAAAAFAAVAPVSGLRLPTPCKTSRAVPVISFHGSADPVDPYQGGGQTYWGYSVPAAAKRWAVHDGCSASPTTSRPVGAAVLVTYSHCRNGATLELYTLAGEGHEWPGGPHLPRRITALLGPQTNAIDADAAIWSFFAKHPL